MSTRIPKEINELRLKLDLDPITEFVEGEVYDDFQYFRFSLDSKNNVTSLFISEIFADKINFNDLLIFRDLTSLNLTECKLSGIDGIELLENIESLYLGGNRIKDIEKLANLHKLRILVLWGNPIEDFSVFSSLKSLENLYCSHTSIQDISSLEKLPNLKGAYLDSCGIKYISKNIAKKLDWISYDLGGDPDENEASGLSVDSNPMEFPPLSVIHSGRETVKNYYSIVERNQDAKLSEGRIIIVGDGASGKSSLIERLIDNSYEEGKLQTNGISIKNWLLKHEERDLTLHFWDFGGQEIQHAVHKFFFTDGCLYVLVLDNRKEEEPEYWLQQIDSLGKGAPVLVVFNKADENTNELADRKFLMEKYPNIIGFHKTSCKTGDGIDSFRKNLEKEAKKLNTINERLPKNWLLIKKKLEELTSGDKHHLNFETYQEICYEYNAGEEDIQKLLLRYFTIIGVVTWFGDTYLNFMHVLSPAWITQGVYKIITSKTTSQKFGNISIYDFKELLKPSDDKDYLYSEEHYGYLLSMMKKFDLCYTADNENILIPSAFGKEPNVEYKDFKGENTRTYIIQFTEYMPIAIIHRFIAQKLPMSYENNYWYTGIVACDSKSDALAMIHSDREAKRIYVRIKGHSPLGQWEHIRREMSEIIESYAEIDYRELVSLGESNITVDYDDLLSYLEAGKSIFFHPKLQRDFNVGYLLGLFEEKEKTIEKFNSRDNFPEDENLTNQKNSQLLIQILNQNNPLISNTVNSQIDIEINVNLELIQKTCDEIEGEASFLIEEIKSSNNELRDNLKRVVEFVEASRSVRSKSDILKGGWKRRLNSITKKLIAAKDQVNSINEGKEAIAEVLKGIQKLATEFDFQTVLDLFK